MYKYLELEYQAFVGLYIIDISVQNITNLRWSATMILLIYYNLQNEHSPGPKKILTFFPKALPPTML